jgi:penicillin-binding protein 1C
LSGAGGPRILFPPDGATIAWDGRDLPLEATGNREPLRWLADGKPLPPTAPRRTLYWQPKGVGFVQLTVIDAAGKSARADIRLAP